MEESSEVHSEENKVSPEKIKKRTFKTPAQIIALEKFYDEHKYPTEEMKSELAERIELTEKQISGWFCHRRLKDKKFLRDGVLSNGRQDRSSGVLQECGSGLGQDSCGSTKLGEYKHVEPRETESEMLDGQDFPPVDHSDERRCHLYSGNVGVIDDTSSESSSSSQDRFYSQRAGQYDLDTSRYITENGPIIPNNAQGVKNMGYKPSGYLKVKGEVENAAITAVKRQLGMHYREDGPPLGVEFQPLPPIAFESPIRNPVHEAYNDGHPAVLHSSDVSRVHKQRDLSTISGENNSKKSLQDLRKEGVTFGILHGSSSHEKKLLTQFKKKSPLPNYANPFPGRNSSFRMCEDSTRETSVYSSKMNNSMISKHSNEGMRSHSIPNGHPPPYGGRPTNEQTDHRFDNYDNISSDVVQRSNYLKSKPSNMLLTCSESVDRNERGPSRRMAKEEKFQGERKTSQEYSDPVRVKAAKRVREEFLQREYGTKPPSAEKPSWTNHIKRSSVDIPSSFSEDETAETSSSLDLVESAVD